MLPGRKALSVATAQAPVVSVPWSLGWNPQAGTRQARPDCLAHIDSFNIAPVSSHLGDSKTRLLRGLVLIQVMTVKSGY